MTPLPLSPYPLNLVREDRSVPFPTAIAVHGLDRDNPGMLRTVETMAQLFAMLPGVHGSFGSDGPYRIVFADNPAIAHAEGYTLTADEGGITVAARTAAGRFYGAQTVYQLLTQVFHAGRFLRFDAAVSARAAAAQRGVPVLRIEDEPRYAVRSFMADIGRAPFSVPLLQRLVRIMAHLKLNTLHLHLNDDELCGFRFEQLPLGRENPLALTAADLRALVAYARSYHVAVLPEIESWGHVHSFTYHYPHLRGGPGQYGGSSFGIGEATYALLEKIYDEIVPCLEDTAAVHLGLDEAKWAVLPGEEDRGHTPENMVGRLHELLMTVGARHGKKLTLHIWADHGGRPVPAALRDRIVVQPWGYAEQNIPTISAQMRAYGGAGKAPVMLGGGASWIRVHGDFEATRAWGLEGAAYPNVLGVTLCLWGTNDLAGRLITLYAGADSVWAPRPPPQPDQPYASERRRNACDQQMRQWQILFPDADPNAINADRGPEVELGRYLWPPRAGEAVAPTADFFPDET
jgi:hypothetical protein